MEYYSRMELAEIDKDIMLREIAKREAIRERTVDKKLGGVIDEEILYFENRLKLVEERIERLKELEKKEEKEEEIV